MFRLRSRSKRDGESLGSQDMRAAFALALSVAACSPAPPQDFEALALGAAYAEFPRSAIDLIVSHSSGKPVACGYARRLDVDPIPRPGEPFIWAEGEMYSGARLFGLSEAQQIRLCGPNWAAPSRLTSGPAAETPAATDRSPAA